MRGSRLRGSPATGFPVGSLDRHEDLLSLAAWPASTWLAREAKPSSICLSQVQGRRHHDSPAWEPNAAPALPGHSSFAVS